MVTVQDNIRKLRNQMNELNSLIGKHFFNELQKRGSFVLNIKSAYWDDWNYSRFHLTQVLNTHKRMVKVLSSLKRQDLDLYNKMVEETYFYVANLS